RRSSDLAKYAKLFAAHAAEAFNVIGKPADAGAYLSAVLTGKQIDAFRFTNTAVESVGSEGGFRVPEPLIAAIWDDAIASGNFLSRATTYPMTAPTATISTPDWEMRTSGVIGGLLGVWLSEAQEGSEDKTLFRNVTLHTHKVAIFSQISSELAEDAINVESDIQTNMQKSTGYTVDHACLYGTGVKQPLGVFNSPALITVAAEGSQTADTLTALNIAKMVARMDPASITKAEWFVSPTLLPELFRLNFQGRTDAGAAVADTVVSAQPLFQSMGDGRYSLFGRPLHLVELMATKGDLGDILFADWSRYAVGIRRGARIERNVAPGWTKDAIDYRITMRVAGLPMNSKPITPQNGDTFSPFVTLAAR
ncbi:MAG: phage major capsid protein, partial [Amphiplicatus sp.]